MVGDRVWLYNPCKKRGLQSNWEGPYILQILSAVTYKLGDGTRKQRRIVHIDRLWDSVEESHFTWDQLGPPSPPGSEVKDDGRVAECAVGTHRNPEVKAVSELVCISPPQNEEKISMADRLRV